MSALVDRITEAVKGVRFSVQFHPDHGYELADEGAAHVAERIAAALPEPLIAARIEAVRDFCTETIEYDSMKVAAPGLTDRAWFAKSVLNILDGLIDQQLTAEERS